LMDVGFEVRTQQGLFHPLPLIVPRPGIGQR
jgi:hypothetical protein